MPPISGIIEGENTLFDEVRLKMLARNEQQSNMQLLWKANQWKEKLFVFIY